MTSLEHSTNSCKHNYKILVLRHVYLLLNMYYFNF